MGTKHQHQKGTLKQGDKSEIQGVMEMESYSGPLPHPRAMKEYEDILSGSTNRIMIMAEKEQEHRHKQEEKIINSDIHLKILGVTVATIIVIAFLCAGVYLIINDKPTQGIVLLMAPLVQIIIAFKKNTKK